jgi:hypothetical protein
MRLFLFLALFSSACLLPKDQCPTGNEPECTGTDRVDFLLSPGLSSSATTGIYLKEIGGPVLSAKNEDFSFEPASSIKVLVHLFAMQQVQSGAARLDDPVTLFAGTSGSCPLVAEVLGTEPLADSLRKMMRFSDNPATRALMEHFGVDVLNDFAISIGLTSTRFETRPGGVPAFNVIGCVAFGAQTVDDHIMSLEDLGIIYEGVADGTLLSGANRDTFYALMSGREMFEEEGFDFTGAFEEILQMINEEAPSELSIEQRQDFIDAVRENAKGGSYIKCLNTCNTFSEWLVMSGWAEFPTCEAGAFSSRSYVWGVFIDDAIHVGGGQTTAINNFFSAYVEPLREPLREALQGWSACYP